MSSKGFESPVKVGKEVSGRTLEMPARTEWPIVLAFGLTLLVAGLLTSVAVSILGSILGVIACLGWFRAVLPHEKHENVAIHDYVSPVTTTRPNVAHVRWMRKELHRARLPLEIYPISAGIKGGLAGSIVMAVLAMMYGVISGHGLWYPVNLLSVGFFPARTTIGQIAVFHWDALITAAVLHLICSLLVGLLYGATLPMLPGRPILLGGILAPVLWSGLLHSILEAVDPMLKDLIDWPWFVATQIGFGIVAGIIVSRQAQIRIRQYLPFGVRAGVEVQHITNDKSGDGQG